MKLKVGHTLRGIGHLSKYVGKVTGIDRDGKYMIFMTIDETMTNGLPYSGLSEDNVWKRFDRDEWINRCVRENRNKIISDVLTDHQE